jgi:hypothetical protein
MAKIDHKRLLSAFYAPAATALSTVDVPELQFLMVDGQGDPNTSPAYQEALEALYGLAYGIRFALKPTVDFTVMPLEGLWWATDPSAFALDDKSAWLWTAMIMQPAEVTPDVFEAVRAGVARKKNPAALPLARLAPYHEGLAAQVLYVGSYADEGPTIARLHAYIAEQGCEPAGKHHEIYLGDPRRTAPDRLKTIIRQPMRPSR